MASLPPYLLDAWRLQHGDLQRALNEEQFNGWTTSSLAETYIKFQLEEHRAASNEQTVTGCLPSLSSITVGSILEELKVSDDIAAAIKTIAESLKSTILKQLLYDQRTPYQILRQFSALPQFLTQEGRTLVDIDEAVLRNERYVRSQRSNNQDSECLVSLEELCGILSETPQDGTPLIFRRKDPPKGGLEVLDELRKRELSIQPSNATFSQTFDRITRGILNGLDWSNVLVAGGIVLTTLLHTDPSKDNNTSVKDPDINLYIYGLGPEDAKCKLEEIHNTWARNLPATAVQRLVVKTAKTINLLTSYPNRRVQIVLKLLHSPTDILLNFDLDACAIGFDGSQVLMLPRCARAIETGYSVFTMDLVWGHHLGNRRASQDSRVFKYAERGFGVRFLPSYARSLEEDTAESTIFKEASSPDMSEDTGDEKKQDTRRVNHLDRKPYGKEPGLKTLKRIAYLGRDFVNRFYFGYTPLAISPKNYLRQRRNMGDTDALESGETTDQEDEDAEEAWNELYRQELDKQIAERVNKNIKTTHDVPRIDFGVLDTTELHSGFPDGRKGLGTLDIFMRHCEAWRLHVRHEAFLVDDGTSSMDYDSQSYDDLPTYDWGVTFDVGNFIGQIEGYSNLLWTDVKEAICCKLGIPFRPHGYVDYSTRRIRYLICGGNLEKVLEKQITIPVVVPGSLENYILSTLPQDYDLPSHFTDFKPLIPVHDASEHDPLAAIVPSLHDTAAESGNLRYWVITNESMWAHQHRVLDEFAELMWSMFHWFHHAMGSTGRDDGRMNTDRFDCIWRLARSFRRRVVLPEITDDQSHSKAMKPGLPSLRETLLFRSWAFKDTITPERQVVGSDVEDGEPHELFADERFLYPFDDDLFWKEGDEGEWDGDGVPSWVEVQD